MVTETESQRWNAKEPRQHQLCHPSVLSFLLYGSETWPLNETLGAMIHGFDSRAFTTIENVRWPHQMTNKALWDRMCQPAASHLTAQHSTHWFGHILHLHPDHPTKALHQFDPQAAGRRWPQGKPCVRWLVAIRMTSDTTESDTKPWEARMVSSSIIIIIYKKYSQSTQKYSAYSDITMGASTGQGFWSFP